MLQMSYNRVARSLLHNDRVTFALLLARIYLRGFNTSEAMQVDSNQFLRGNRCSFQITCHIQMELICALSIHPDIKTIKGLSDEQRENLQRLAHLDDFKSLP